MKCNDYLKDRHMRMKVGTELLDNKNFDRGRNTLLLVIYVEKSLMKTRKEEKQICSKRDIKFFEKKHSSLKQVPCGTFLIKVLAH